MTLRCIEADTFYTLFWFRYFLRFWTWWNLCSRHGQQRILQQENDNLKLKLAMAPFVKGKLFCRSQVIMTNTNVANPFPPHLPIEDFTL